MDLTGKAVVVTGGCGALGTAVARQAQNCGATVTLMDVVANSNPVVAAARYIRVDLSDLEETIHSFEDVGPVDAVCCTAGGFAMGRAVHELSEADVSSMYNVNVRTMHNVVRAIAPRMIQQGHGKIVTIGALSALQGRASQGAYCAAKSTVARLTESMSEELRPRNVNVNAVLPGIIDTPANRHAMPDADFSTWVQPVKLANVICFLMSEAASSVHGALIPVRGLA